MSRRTVKNIKSVFWYIGALIISLITVYPFLWMIATSFKPEAEIYSSSLSLFSENFSLANYTKVFDTIPFGRYFMNSLFLAVAGVLTNIFLGALAGYSFAKLKFKGRKTMFSLLLSSMMIPGVITMIPQFLVLKNFPLVGGNNILGQGGQGFINNYAAIILPGAVGAYAVFFMKQFFETLPDDLAEAARMDGCSADPACGGDPWNYDLPVRVEQLYVADDCAEFQGYDDDSGRAFHFPVSVQYDVRAADGWNRYCYNTYAAGICFCTEVLYPGYCFQRRKGIGTDHSGQARCRKAFVQV